MRYPAETAIKINSSGNFPSNCSNQYKSCIDLTSEPKSQHNFDKKNPANKQVRLILILVKNSKISRTHLEISNETTLKPRTSSLRMIVLS